MTERLAENTALILIDVQLGFDDPSWGTRNNPGCEANIAALLSHWRERAHPVIFVRHDSREPDSPLAPGSPGNAFKDVISGDPDLLVVKTVNSAFYGEPDLHDWLQESEIRSLVIAGITTNHCCETTARMAGNLGYDTLFVLDATHTFGRTAPSRQFLDAGSLASRPRRILTVSSPKSWPPQTSSEHRTCQARWASSTRLPSGSRR